MSGQIMGPGEQIEPVLPQSREIGERLAAEVVKFGNGLYAGFVAEYEFDQERLIEALKVAYGTELLRVWANPPLIWKKAE